MIYRHRQYRRCQHRSENILILHSLVAQSESQLVVLGVEESLGLQVGQETRLLSVDGADQVSLSHLLGGHGARVDPTDPEGLDRV